MSAHKRVRVCIRVRPPPRVVQGKEEEERVGEDSVQVNATEQTISVVTNRATGAGTCFHFDQVLTSRVNQAGVFTAAAQEIVDSVLDGYNGTIMAYGQTGAGKTFTMSGGRRSFEDRGICARAISSVFQQIHRDSAHSFVVRVSYMEVYNENIYDLLNFNDSQHPITTNHNNNNNNSNSNSSTRSDLVVQENEKGQTFVRGLTRPVVKTEEHAFDLLFQGETNRTIAEHCLNASSTRSHCLFSIYVEKSRTVDSEEMDGTDGGAPTSAGMTVFSKLHLVDLAGSERMKKTAVSGVMLKEASHINKSLTFLEQVVLALGDKKRTHVPYRQTPLTNLLKDSLGGNCRTMLVACVWPEESHNDQTLATLKFATRMMRVKTSATINVAGAGRGGGSGGAGPSAETRALLQRYVQEISQLKQELAMHDSLSGRTCIDNKAVNYDRSGAQSMASRDRMRAQIMRFLADEAQPPAIVNLAQTQALFTVFRALYHEQAATITAQGVAIATPLTSSSPRALPATESRMVAQFRALRASSPSIESQEGGERTRGSLPLVAPSQQQQQHQDLRGSSSSSCRSSSSSSSCRRRSASKEQMNEHRPEDDDGDGDSARIHRLPPLGKTPHVRSDKELLAEFHRLENPRPEALLDLEVAKRNLRQAKSAASTLALDVNRLKSEIDMLSGQLQVAQTPAPAREGQEDGGGDGEDQWRGDHAAMTEGLVLQLKGAKKRYREAFDAFQEKKAEIAYVLKIKEQMLQKVSLAFEQWKLARMALGDDQSEGTTAAAAMPT